MQSLGNDTIIGMDTTHCSVVVLIMALLRTTFAVTDPDITALYQKKFHGEGTYYGDTPRGTCQYFPPAQPPVAQSSEIKYLAALNAPQFMNSKACGMCFKVHGTGEGKGNDPIKGDFLVFIKDLCPECKEGDVDIATDGDGRWKLEIQATPCPVGDTKIEYMFQGANGWYVKLQIRNARIPPALVRIKVDDVWKDMQRTKDGFWTLSAKFTFPIDVEITSAEGDVVNDQIQKLVNDQVLHGNGVQFGSGGSTAGRSESAAAPLKKPSSTLLSPLGLFVQCLCTIFVISPELTVMS